MGKYLGEWAPPAFLNLNREQVQNPDTLVYYLEKACCDPGNSRETQITAAGRGLDTPAPQQVPQYPQAPQWAQ